MLDLRDSGPTCKRPIRQLEIKKEKGGEFTWYRILCTDRKHIYTDNTVFSPFSFCNALYAVTQKPRKCRCVCVLHLFYLKEIMTIYNENKKRKKERKNKHNNNLQMISAADT